MITRFSLVSLALVAGMGLACSGSTNPTVPDNPVGRRSESFRFTSVGENTLILGAWDVMIDVEAGTAEALPIRTAEAHFDVTVMIKPPKCYDCFQARNLSFDSDTKVLTVDIGFKNPSNITGYDIRGIVTEFGYMEFVNPDGYTDLLCTVPGELNPFLAYDTGHGQREFGGLQVHFETMQIYNPMFPEFAPFTYLVEASWPDNCKEPYEVLYCGISNDLFSDGSNSPTLQIAARDWQDNVESVTADLAPVGGGIVSFSPNGALLDVWEADVSCAPGTPVGDYEVMVTAITAPPFDQTAAMHNYITLRVVNPPEPGEEVFGSPERVSDTPGESFIWPRHAIAVTGDGTSHVAWIDNSPDPQSNDFHVYYSKRESGVWSVPQLIDGSEGRAFYATIAADPDDTVHIVWEDERDHVLGSDICYASSADDFAGTSILYAGDDGLSNVHPKIDCGDDGTLHVIWHTLEIQGINDYEYDVWYMKKPAGGGPWQSALSVVANEDIFEAYPSLAPGPSGSAYVAFQSDASGPHGIFFTRNQTGSFIVPIVVAVSEAHQPSLEIAADGSLLVAYFDYIDDSYTDIYLRRSTDTGDTWGSPEPVSESDDAYQYAPDIECTDEGDIHIAWHEENEQGRPGRVLYREYLNGSGWRDILKLVDSPGMGAFPSMDSDSAGHIHVAYELYTSAAPLEDNYEIWYRDSVP